MTANEEEPMKAAEKMQQALDVWTEDRERTRRSSGVVPRGSTPPPALPASAVVPPPLPVERLRARVSDLEADLAFLIDATDRRLTAVEERQQRIVAIIGDLEARMDKLTAWALRLREQLNGWSATVDTAHLQDLDGKLHALQERVDLELSAIAERFAEDRTAREPATDLNHIASQLDALLGQISLWRAEQEALKEQMQER